MKIVIMGYSGSGKSTLCRTIAEMLCLPPLHLDTVHFLPDWQERSSLDEETIVKAFLAEHRDGWVIDGNYTKLCYEERIEAADRIILMLFSRVDCFSRCLKRFRAYHGNNRPDMAEGCPEKFDGEFMRWILWEGRSRKIRENYKKLQRRYPEKTVVLKNQRQLDSFLSEIQV